MRENTDQNNSEYRHFLCSEQKQRRWQKISNADCENIFYFLNDSSLKKYIWSFVNTHGGVSISGKLQAFTIKIITPPWMLFNCANGTKSRKASHFFYHLEIVSQGLSFKKVFSEMLQNPQENTCDGVSF